MLMNNVFPRVLGLALAVAAGASMMQPHESQDKTSVLNSPVDEKTAVRFFYNPEGDYYHYPLVFRAVPDGDSHLNTAPMTPEGRTAYISKREMAQLLQELARSRLSWQESEKIEPLGSFKRLLWFTNMKILVVSSKGTAGAEIDPKEICQTLTPLDFALKTPRALWELQRFRLNYICKVPGFKYDAYPDHY